MSNRKKKMREAVPPRHSLTRDRRKSSNSASKWRRSPLKCEGVSVHGNPRTTTKTGLAIRSELDEGSYPTGRKISDEPMEALSIKRDKFHGEWNYSILTRR